MVASSLTPRAENGIPQSQHFFIIDDVVRVLEDVAAVLDLIQIDPSDINAEVRLITLMSIGLSP